MRIFCYFTGGSGRTSSWFTGGSGLRRLLVGSAELGCLLAVGWRAGWLMATFTSTLRYGVVGCGKVKRGSLAAKLRIKFVAKWDLN